MVKDVVCAFEISIRGWLQFTLQGARSMKWKIMGVFLLGFLASCIGCSSSNESGGSGANSSEVENFAGYTTYADKVTPREAVPIQAGDVAAENRRFFCEPDNPSDSVLCGQSAADLKDACDAVANCLSFLFVRLGGGEMYAERYTDLINVTTSPSMDYYTKDEPQE